MTTIYQALSAVMADVQAVGKHDKNTAPGGGYNFRGIDAVTNAVGPALRKHGVIVVPRILSSEYAAVESGKARTQMSSSRLVIEYTWYGPDGDSIVSSAAGEAFDSGDKATSKAHSVAFRTAMIQTLCLPTDEPDPDESTYQRSDRQAEQPATPPAEPDLATQARARLLEVCTQAGITPAAAVRQFAEMNNGADLRNTEDHYAVDRFTDWMRQEWADAQAAQAAMPPAGDPA